MYINNRNEVVNMLKDREAQRRQAIEALIKLEATPVRLLSDDALASKEAGLLDDIKQLALDVEVRWISPEEAASSAFSLITQLGLTGWERERRKRRRCG
jgi:hypothetical protein